MLKVAFRYIVFFYLLGLFLYADGNAVRNEDPNPFSFDKDGAYHLEHNAKILDSYLAQVHKQSLMGDYPYYGGRPLIEYTAYHALENSKRELWRGGIVLVGAYISEFIKYSHLGGVGIGAKLKQDDVESFYLSFDGRYFTDLDLLGIGRKIYAYCVLPRFDKCIMLGIGEEW